MFMRKRKSERERERAREREREIETYVGVYVNEKESMCAHMRKRDREIINRFAPLSL